MPNFVYTAKTLEDKTVTGTSLAKDLRELSKSLRNEGLFLIRAVSKDEKKKKWLDFSFSLSSKVPTDEKIMLTRNLAVMVATGLSLVKSFDVLANQAKNKRLKVALFAIKEQINKGQSISSAMSRYPDIFSDFFLSMMEIGEESGTLEDVLKILALQLEKEHRLKSGVQSAMIYPIIILSLMIVVGGIVAVVVLPRLKQFFSGLNAKIPFYTKALIDFGEFSIKNWPLLIIIPVILGFFTVMALKTKKGKWLKDTILLKTPIFSPLVKKNNCAILIRSLSSLLGSGVSLTRSLEVASGTMGNFYFKRAVKDALERVKKGENLSVALSSYRDIFPYGAIELVEVGEETGKTAMVLKTLAEFYEEEVISATAKLSALIEPALIIVMGVIVAFFAFSIIEPMYSSLGAIK